MIRIYSQDIGTEVDTEKCAKTHNEEWEKTNGGRNRTTKSGKQ